MLFWWKKYVFHGLRTGIENLETKHKLFQLRDNDTQGPIFPHALLPPTIDKDPNHHIVITVTQSLSARWSQLQQRTVQRGRL